ncbi:cobalamin B12-binding domain-containing protein [Mycoplasmatota bacterium]|nr:cobalamin B12-binding domain-containing protein [Mycoplasmatota bacterium]
MEKKYQHFISMLDKENKDDAILFIHDLLEKDMSIIDVYENFIIPSLADYECNSSKEEICIWKEHTRTSIIRTILESTYPYLIKARKQDSINKLIVLACPQEEYHEIGAIVSANYFYLMGYKVKYIGANTPNFEIKSALKILQPDYLALSITNYYNLIQTKKLLEEIVAENDNVKIILGGQAIKKHRDDIDITYHYILNSLDDIKRFRGEDK